MSNKQNNTAPKHQPSGKHTEGFRPGRRTFIGMSVLAVGGVLARAGYKYLFPGDPITQDMVDEVYDRLYGEIKTARDAAREQGKKLFILGAESHVYRNELLMQYMLVDISRRLNIGMELVEYDKETMHMSVDQQTENARAVKGQSGKAWSDVTAPTLMAVSPDSEQIKALSRSFIGSAVNQSMPNAAILLTASCATGMQHYPIVPPRPLTFVGDEKAWRLSQEIEDGMVVYTLAAFALNPRDGMGIVGAAHFPKLYETMKAQKDISVFPIDTIGGALDVLIQNNLLPSEKAVEKSREYIKLRDSGQLFISPFKGDWQVYPWEAAIMAGRASLRHRENNGEIKPKEAAYISEIFDRAEKVTNEELER